MIRYSLKCDKDHEFESWFQSADAYEKLAQSGMVTCSICSSSEVQKSIMTPRIGKNTTAPRPLSAPATAAEQAVKELRAHIEANSENVGKDFATEARKIHHGEAPERSIYGEAKPEEAKSLIEDGVPVAPLPFMNKGKTN